MSLFNQWLEQKIIRPKKVKTAVVAHTDIDQWLKSVDLLAKDLQDLKNAKSKSQDKINQIQKKYKPEEPNKSEENPENINKKDNSDKDSDKNPENQVPKKEIELKNNPKEKEIE